MPFQLQCQNCGKTLHVPDHLAGKQASCSYCRNTVAIPPLANVEPQVAASSPPGIPPANQMAEQPIIQATESPVRMQTQSPVPGLAILSGIISTVLGIICCIIGGFGSIVNYMGFSMMRESMKSAPVASQALDLGATYAIGVTVLMLIFGIALVTASVGLFRGRRWGWILSLILVGVGAIAGGISCSYYSTLVDRFEAAIELGQQEQTPGMDRAQAEEMRTDVYPMLKWALFRSG